MEIIMKTVFIILLAVLAALLLILFIACGFIFNQVIWGKTIPVPKFILKLIAGNVEPSKFDTDHAKAVENLKNYPLEKITLTAPDGARLNGYVLAPEKSNGRLIVACHGAHSSAFSEFCFITPYLYEKGYTLVMPEHRGCGNSDGKFLGYGTHESVDTYLWVDYARERFPEASVFLMGVSMGGATVLMMSDKAESRAVKGIIADCPYTSAWDEFSYQLKTSFKLPEFPILYICDLYCRIFSHYAFKDASPLNAVKNAKKPILFIHGRADDFVPFFMQKELYDACASEKAMLAVDGAIHARSYYTDSEAYEKAIEGFMDKYDK